MSGCNGIFVISLDFELYWGAWPGEDTEEGYKQRLFGSLEVIPQLLNLFSDYGIHATWAVVGLLFFENRSQLLRNLPARKPSYTNHKLSIYENLEKVLGENEDSDPLHYAASLIREIKLCQNQEIGTHTFAHYYCLEQGQDVDEFRSDLEAAIKVSRDYCIDIKSIVFPMNQANSEYLSICRELGIKCYRRNPRHYLYKNVGTDRSVMKSAFRLLDTFFNISGHHCYCLGDIEQQVPFDIRWSRFLRPYGERLKILETLKLRRILLDMTYAARNGLVYHLWWHPYNFGLNIEKNISFLRKIMDHYKVLKENCRMISLNMAELSEFLSKEAGDEG